MSLVYRWCWLGARFSCRILSYLIPPDPTAPVGPLGADLRVAPCVDTGNLLSTPRPSFLPSPPQHKFRVVSAKRDATTRGASAAHVGTRCFVDMRHHFGLLPATPQGCRLRGGPSCPWRPPWQRQDRRGPLWPFERCRSVSPAFGRGAGAPPNEYMPRLLAPS